MHEHTAIGTKIAYYTAGFVLSVLLTLAAYFTVVNGLLTGTSLVAAIAGLAIAQLLVQLVFFLHLGVEKKPRFNLVALCFVVLIIGILVGGTLWIMENLDSYMMPHHEMEQYMNDNAGF